MRYIIMIITHLICFNLFSQKVKTQYFLIDKNDTLIKKQIATKNNKFEGYTIINENNIIKEYIRSSKINEDDIEVDTFDSFSFTFNRNNDTIVDKTYLKNHEIIKTRKEFFRINIGNDIFEKRIIFIEHLKCEKFILREVRPIVFE